MTIVTNDYYNFSGAVINTKKEIFINLENKPFKGNVLDIGFQNFGIVYNIYKEFNDNASIEYVNGKDEKENIKKGVYDSCILLFSFSSIWLRSSKFKLIKEINDYLKENGALYIWDIDKGFTKVFNSIIKILIPGRKLKEIYIKDLNVIKDSSKENTLSILDPFFDIVDFKASNDIYYIKAVKKKVINEIYAKHKELEGR